MKPVFCYSSSAEDRKRLERAYAGFVSISGSSYNIQSHFEMEGYFQVKKTPMGVVCVCWKKLRRV